MPLNPNAPRKENIKEFYENHDFPAGMSKKQRVKQAVAVGYAVERRGKAAPKKRKGSKSVLEQCYGMKKK